MELSKKEAQEWRSLQAKSKKHGVSVKRIGPANVTFGGDVYAQLGTGNATVIMDARIKVGKRLMASGFNHRGRRYTYSVTRGMAHSLAKEKLAQRQRLAPRFLWAIHRVSDGTYGLGRAERK